MAYILAYLGCQEYFIQSLEVSLRQLYASAQSTPIITYFTLESNSPELKKKYLAELLSNCCSHPCSTNTEWMEFLCSLSISKENSKYETKRDPLLYNQFIRKREEGTVLSYVGGCTSIYGAGMGRNGEDKCQY